MPMVPSCTGLIKEPSPASACVAGTSNCTGVGGKVPAGQEEQWDQREKMHRPPTVGLLAGLEAPPRPGLLPLLICRVANLQVRCRGPPEFQYMPR